MIDGVGECLADTGVPRSLPAPSTFRFFAGGFLMSVDTFRFAIDDLGAGRFFEAAGFGVSEGDCSITSAVLSFFADPRTLVPYSFCASAIACSVAVSTSAAVALSMLACGAAARSSSFTTSYCVW